MMLTLAEVGPYTLAGAGPWHLIIVIAVLIAIGAFGTWMAHREK